LEVWERSPSITKNVNGGPLWEAMTEIWERPPLTQKISTVGPMDGGVGESGASTINAKMSTVGPLGGDARDPGALTINIKKHRWCPPGPHGGSGLHPRSEICVVNLHGYDTQKVILLIGPTFPALGPVMADDP
jgi:hypothetical protein